MVDRRKSLPAEIFGLIEAVALYLATIRELEFHCRGIYVLDASVPALCCDLELHALMEGLDLDEFVA